MALDITKLRQSHALQRWQPTVVSLTSPFAKRDHPSQLFLVRTSR